MADKIQTFLQQYVAVPSLCPLCPMAQRSQSKAFLSLLNSDTNLMASCRLSTASFAAGEMRSTLARRHMTCALTMVDTRHQSCPMTVLSSLHDSKRSKERVG